MSTDFYQIFSLYLSRGQGRGGEEGRGWEEGKERMKKDIQVIFFIKELIQQF